MLDVELMAVRSAIKPAIDSVIVAVSLVLVTVEDNARWILSAELGVLDAEVSAVRIVR